LDIGLLDVLKSSLLSEVKTIKKESCWILSNLAAGIQIQIEALVLNNVLPMLITIIDKEEDDVLFIN
jgi:importin subunit alpha-1